MMNKEEYVKKSNNENNGIGSAERLEVHPQFIVGDGTQAQIILRHLLEIIRQFFGFLPSYIVPLALDSTGQVSCAAPLLAEQHFLNIAQAKAEYILKHMSEYPELQKWFPASSQELVVGMGAAGWRAVGGLFFVSALPLITRALTERLAQFRPEAIANVEAECNRDRRLTSKGVTVNGSMVDVWIISTTVGGTSAATIALATSLAKLAEVE